MRWTSAARAARLPLPTTGYPAVRERPVAGTSAATPARSSAGAAQQGDAVTGSSSRARRLAPAHRTRARHYIFRVSATTPILFDYARFVEGLKRRIDGARLSAARAVNRELVALYWDMGQAIREQQAHQGWGDAVVDRLARDLKASFPGTAGFSAASLWRMRQFHETYTAPEFLAQLVRESGCDTQRPRGSKALAVADRRQLAQAVRDMVEAVPWGHHVNLLSRLEDAGQRLFYLKATARFGRMRSALTCVPMRTADRLRTTGADCRGRARVTETGSRRGRALGKGDAIARLGIKRPA